MEDDEVELPTFDETAVWEAAMMSCPEQDPANPKSVKMSLKMRFEEKVYDVLYFFGGGYPVGTAIFCWEENNQSCDHNRALILDDFHPGVIPKDHPARGFCGPSYLEVVEAKIELVEIH